VITIKNFFSKLNNWAERFADKMSDWFGHPLFLLGNMLAWGIWIVAGAEQFPYGGLTLLVSLEAIFMSILILNTSTRKGHADTRLMIKDLEISEDIQDDIDNIHDHIAELKEMLEDEER